MRDLSGKRISEALCALSDGAFSDFLLKSDAASCIMKLLVLTVSSLATSLIANGIFDSLKMSGFCSEWMSFFIMVGGVAFMCKKVLGREHYGEFPEKA